jgi:sporulation protein YlmC with PRC-barrel domain
MGQTTGLRSDSTGYLPVKAHQFLGMHVSDRAGQDVGEVKEILLDSGHQKVSFALISADRALDLGNRYLAVPWTALDVQSMPDSDKAHFVISMDREQLKGAPSINKDAWSELDSASFDQQINSFYQTSMTDVQRGAHDIQRDIQRGSEELQRDVKKGAEDISRDIDRSTDQFGSRSTETLNRDLYTGDYARPDAARDSVTDTGDVARDTGMTRDVAKQSFDNRKLSKVIGMSIMQNNEKIGKIEDLVIDHNSGSCLYAICSYDRSVEGASGKWAALPWTIFSPSADAKAFAVSADMNSLKAVAYDKNSLPLLADRSFAMSINDRFNVTSGVYGFVGADAGRGEAALSTCSGTIDEINVVDQGGFKDMLHLKVKGDDGKFVWVYAGPKSFLDTKQIKFNEGEKIDVSGTKTVIDGKAIILAHDVTVGNNIVHLRDAQGAPLWGGARELKQDVEGMTPRRDYDMERTPATPSPSVPSDTGTRSY